MNTSSKSSPGIGNYWDAIAECEIDASWRNGWSADYAAYRQRFERAQIREYLGDFPISIEIEASYFCNLECPFCPRVVAFGQREIGHMSNHLWQKILEECKDNGLNALQMDHEAESMMNPRFFEMLEDAKNTGIMDIWLHTNANMLNPEKSARLIDEGLTKINFSIDAVQPATYDVLRVGGNFDKVIRNVRDFLRIKREKQASYLRTRVSFVEQRANIGEKTKFFDFWKSQDGLNLVAFQECIDFTPFDRPDQDAQLSEEALEKKYASTEPFHCSMPWQTPIVDTEGSVIPCGSPVREHNRAFILGNLNAGDTIKSCWTGDKMNKLRELHNRGEWYKNPMCRVCVNTLRQSRKNLLALREQAVEREIQDSNREI